MIPCSCGASVQAPTMLRMSSLEPAPEEEASQEASRRASRSTWGLTQAMTFLGGVLLGIAAVGGVLLIKHRPVSPYENVDPEQVRESSKTLAPLRTFEIWETMQQGLDRRQDQRFVAAMIHYQAWQIVTGVVAISGIALVGAGIALKKKRSSAT